MAISVGGSGLATATLNNPIAADDTIVFGSDNTAVATVQAKPNFNAGDTVIRTTVTGQGPGTYNLSCTVTNADGVQANAAAQGTVNPAPPPDVTAINLQTP